MATTKAPAKKAVAPKKKLTAKASAKTTKAPAKSTKAPVKKKSILHRIFRSQKGLVKQQALSTTQIALTAGVLGAIGLIGVYISHAGSNPNPLADSLGCYANSGGQAPVLKVNTFNNNCVHYLQVKLNEVHAARKDMIFAHNNAALVPDGDFGPLTDTAVKQYQKVVLKTAQNGVVNQNMWNHLGAPQKYVAPKVQPKHNGGVTSHAVVNPTIIPKVTISQSTSSYFDPEVAGHYGHTYCVTWSTNVATSDIKGFGLNKSSNAVSLGSVIGAYSPTVRKKCYDQNKPSGTYTIDMTLNTGKIVHSGFTQF